LILHLLLSKCPFGVNFLQQRFRFFCVGKWIDLCGTAHSCGDAVAKSCTPLTGRLAGVFYLDIAGNEDGLQFQIACAELVGAVVNLVGAWREFSARSKHDRVRAWLSQRQCNKPHKLADFIPYCPENIQNPFPWYKVTSSPAQNVTTEG
jgi:hypothetical protein